jgi:hypothetical protein
LEKQTMNKIRFALQSLSILVVILAGSTLTYAQATRTWVSGVGDDANPCSRTAPCRTFAGAIGKTQAAGEINVLDPGGFGGVTITKSITISSTFEAGVLVPGQSFGIIVNAGATDKVILKGLDIEGINGQAVTGIRYIGGGHLLVEDCTINGFGTAGIEVDFTGQPAGTNAGLNVKHVRISNTPVGIRLNNTVGGFSTALINDLQAINIDTFGLQTQTNAFATITNSRFDHNGSALQAENNSNINAENVTMTLNTNGVHVVSPAATIRISNCDIFSNTTGISVTPGGKVISFGNNRLAGNTTAGAPTSTVSQN